MNEKLGICAGWVQHPGSFSDCMPLWNKTNDVCLIFCGEHFPEGRGAPDRNGGAPDARSVMELFEEKGPAFLTPQRMVQRSA